MKITHFRDFSGYFQGVFRVISGSFTEFQGTSRVFSGCFRMFFIVFSGCFFPCPFRGKNNENNAF